jgi:hypothetical protein
MMKRGNDAIGSCHWVKSKLPFRELFRNTNFCIQIMWQKGSTFLAIVTPRKRFAPLRLPKRSFIFFKVHKICLRFKICIPAFCTIARISLFSGQCECLSRRLVNHNLSNTNVRFCGTYLHITPHLSSL